MKKLVFLFFTALAAFTTKAQQCTNPGDINLVSINPTLQWDNSTRCHYFTASIISSSNLTQVSLQYKIGGNSTPYNSPFTISGSLNQGNTVIANRLPSTGIKNLVRGKKYTIYVKLCNDNNLNNNLRQLQVTAQ